MLADISNVDAIYIVCGRTDMRKSIDGLCAIIQEQFSMEIDHALFLFCGRKCDRIKAILKEPDGIVMIYKRLTAQGSYRWPRNKSEVRNLTWREFDWLMSGIDIEQPKAIKTPLPPPQKAAHKLRCFPYIFGTFKAQKSSVLLGSSPVFWYNKDIKNRRKKQWLTVPKISSSVS